MFFPSICLVFWVLDRVLPQSLKLAGCNLLLLVGSYYFYMCWQPVYALLLLASTLVTWLAGLAIGATEDERRKKTCLTVSLVLNLAILFFFKYFNFAAESVTAAMEACGVKMDVPGLNVLLPVGISFYIFQALGYSIDVYRGKTEVEHNVLTYALFVSFFPQLVAGPIERSTNLLQQFKERRRFDYERVMSGLGLMVWGYFLKLVLADRCSDYVDAVFNNVAMHNGGSYILASFIFTFQIYGDFAGYSLIAIGAARILGYNLVQNFRQPYFAASVTEFWHRWHISLSTWFKDYVYIPLGGNRCSKMNNYRNILVTFLVSGLWHGANWTYVVWGGIHGLLQCFEKAIGWNKGSDWSGLKKAAHVALTFVIVAIAWMFFRANNLTEAWDMITGMVLNFGVPYITPIPFIYIGIGIAGVIAHDYIIEFGKNVHISDSPHFLVRYLYLVLMGIVILSLGALGGGKFIYFQF